MTNKDEPEDLPWIIPDPGLEEVVSGIRRDLSDLNYDKKVIFSIIDKLIEKLKKKVSDLILDRTYEENIELDSKEMDIKFMSTINKEFESKIKTLVFGIYDYLKGKCKKEDLYSIIDNSCYPLLDFLLEIDHTILEAIIRRWYNNLVTSEITGGKN